MFKIGNHPCFNEEISKVYPRVHLPVVPNCNIQCKYCNRKYDCVNESRPGVTSKIMSPQEACNYLIESKNKMKNLSVAGFAGPGDSLANFQEVRETIELIKQNGVDILFCLSTNGLMLPDYAPEIIELGISYLTITINTVDENLVPLIYERFEYKGKMLNPVEAAPLFIHNQLSGLKMLSSSGIICKVNILCLQGINDSHTEKIVRTAKEYGAYMTNITKLIPAKGSVFEDLQPVDEKKLMQIRKDCSVLLKQMYHCKQCRADASGLLC